MIADNDASVRRHKTDTQDGAQSAGAVLTKADENDLPRMSDSVAGKTFVSTTLCKLYRAFQFAQDCDRSKWDFAVELDVLTNDGVALEEIRWLMGKGLIDHAMEIESAAGVGRGFDTSGGFSISDRSCFVISENGMLFVEQELLDSDDPFQIVPDPKASSNIQLDSNETPLWDDQRHELRVGNVVVKRFKWRAINQEAILNAFQEDGWPARIDDPLPPAPETDPKRRLSDAIKCLNRKQKNSLLRFSGDGTGEGVLWEFVGVSEVRF